MTFPESSYQVFKTVSSTFSYAIVCWQWTYDAFAEKIVQCCGPGQQIKHLVLDIETMMAELAGLATLLLYILNC